MSAEAAHSPQPCDEVFPTPKNDFFYATHPYSALDANGKKIRLLKILPNDGTGQIKCVLLPGRPLSEVQGLYSALSYCAGDPQITDTILVNDVRFNAFANLRHALGEVREFWAKTHQEHEKDLLLWTDQICINQKDSQERSHQVGFMRDIYEQAEQVLACLSTSKGSRKGMEWLLELVDNVPALDNDNKPRRSRKQHTYKVNNDSAVERVAGTCRERSHFYRLKNYMWTRLSDESFVRGWLAFYDVVGNPWWSRAWIFQEFLVARELHLLYRRRFIAWNSALPILKLLLDLHVALHTHFFELNDEFVEDSIEHHNTDRIRTSLYQCGYRSLLNVVDFMIGSKDDWTGEMRIRDLLTHARYCNTTDLRDKVYAFIGMADPRYQIVPDYSVSLNQVLTTVTRRIIEYEDSLDILTNAVVPRLNTRADLPSWVVDWTEKELGDLRNNDFGSKFWKDMTGLPEERPDASFVLAQALPNPQHLTLAVWGVYLGMMVTKVVDDMWPQLDDLFGSFETEDGVHVSCSSAVQHFDQLWFLQGSRSLFVMRGFGRSYVMVSAAFITTLPFQGNSVSDYVEKGERLQGGRQRISII
jgi:hypothetical protein